MSKQNVINIGLCGFGTVGQGVWKHLTRARADLETRLDVRLEVRRVAVKNIRRKRKIRIPLSKLTDDALSVATDPNIDIVC